MENKEPESDAIFKYLGLQVHPGKIQEFWESDDEKKRFLSGVRTRGGQLSVLDRDTALVNIDLMSGTDRVISLIGGIILIIAFFLPVYSIGLGERAISGSAISYFINLPFIGRYAAWGGFGMIITMIVFALLLLSCPAAGVLNILGLYNKKKGDEYLATVKRFSRFNYVPILLYLALMVLLVLGGPHPFGSLGIDGLGESLGLLSIFTMTGIAFWLNIVGLAIGFAQSRGL